MPDEFMNNGHGMLLPLTAMLMLTLLVYFRLYFSRVPHLIRKRINPQKLATRAQVKDVFISERQEQISDNVKNLFEAPVLFYVLALGIEITGMTDAWFIGLAWFFVATRAVHSIIHCTYNTVVHRFAVFITGVVTLAVMTLRFGWLLLG